MLAHLYIFISQHFTFERDYWGAVLGLRPAPWSILAIGLALGYPSAKPPIESLEKWGI